MPLNIDVCNFLNPRSAIGNAQADTAPPVHFLSWGVGVVMRPITTESLENWNWRQALLASIVSRDKAAAALTLESW